MRILLTGGGTMGSVSPLLAVKEQMANTPEVDFLWIGTRKGPERAIIEQNNISFKTIPAGKLRRYFDWRNITDVFLAVAGFLKSLGLIWWYNPDVILTAGSFVSVPVAFAGYILRKKIIIHQQDLKIGLANKVMKVVATKITVTFEEMRDKFPKQKVVITGNPVRPSILKGTRLNARQRFKLEENLPTLLVTGGGLGAEVINKVFVEAAEQLTKFCQVIHITGNANDKVDWMLHPLIQNNRRYHAYHFFTEEMADAYAAADLVVSRAGFSSLTEITALQKPAIIIPIPNNQQVDNAIYYNNKNAIIYVQQQDLDSEYIVTMVLDLFENTEKLQRLQQNIAQIMPAQANVEYEKLIQDLTV